MRKIYQVESIHKVARVYFNSEYQEYRVKFYVRDLGPNNELCKAIHLKDADYFDSDKQAAIDTANAWVK